MGAPPPCTFEHHLLDSLGQKKGKTGRWDGACSGVSREVGGRSKGWKRSRYIVYKKMHEKALRCQLSKIPLKTKMVTFFVNFLHIPLLITSSRWIQHVHTLKLQLH